MYSAKIIFYQIIIKSKNSNSDEFERKKFKNQIKISAPEKNDFGLTFRQYVPYKISIF